MKHPHHLPLAIGWLLWLAAVPAASAAEVAPNKHGGKIEVALYHATDGDPAQAGKGASTVPEDLATRLRAEKSLCFKHYRLLGRDSSPLDPSNEHWAKPVKPSEEVMVRFTASSKPETKHVVLDVELWLSHKKILKTDVGLCRHKPLWIRGPAWRGGHLIIAISFIPD